MLICLDIGKNLSVYVCPPKGKSIETNAQGE
jgi:hypothetical protein